MAMNFHSDNGLFESAFTVLRIYNAYSTINRSTLQHTQIPEELIATHTFPSLTVGDLNIHYHLSNPTRLLSYSELNVSSQYYELAADRLYSLLNTPGVFTRFPFDSTTRPAVLDLSFANAPLAPYIGPWSPPSPQLVLTILLSPLNSVPQS